MATEATIKVASDASGQDVRNVQVDPGSGPVLQQVISVAKSDGTLIDDLATQTTLAAILTKLAAGLPTALVSDRMKVDASGTTVPVSGPLTAAQLAGTPVAVTGPIEVTVGSSSSDLGKLEDAAHASSDKGIAVWAVRRDADTSLVDATGDYAPFQVNALGALKVAISGTQPVSAASLPLPAGATTEATLATVAAPTDCSVYHVISAASTNAANVKTSAGKLYGWCIGNNGAAAAYVKLHNTAGTPTAGAGVVKTIMIPAGGGSNMPVGLRALKSFGTGIGISIVTGMADADATAVAVSQVSVELFYI